MPGAGTVIAPALTRAFLAAALAGLAALPGRGAAEPRPLDARVVWARADRAYIAALDSIALAPGDLLTFTERGRNVASGEVAQVLAPDLAAARLTLGSLARVSRLDRVRILAERPPLVARPMLRIGCPGRGRSNLLFDCARPTPRPPLAAAAYRTDSLAENAYRLVRAGVVPSAAPWPDTMLVRLFGEAADEEIALERGELDLAVFWPGEASSRLRADPRWSGPGYGSRSRGVLAAILERGSAGEAATRLSPDLPSLAALNEELFRGDLGRWPDASESAPPTHSPPGSPPEQAAKFVVDPACPGRLPLERFLDRATPAAGAQVNRPAVRLFYLDSPVRSPDTLARDVALYVRNGSFPKEVRARADTLGLEIERLAPGRDPGASERLGQYLRDSLQVTFLFTVRCPLVCEPGLRAYVNALGPDALADMLECRTGRAP